MQDLLPWMAPWGAWGLYALMLFAGGVLVALGWFGRRFHHQPRCPKCGYDRTGLPGPVCPECGYAPTRPWEPYTSRRRRLSLILLGLIVASALPGVAVTRRVRTYGWEYYRRVGPVYSMFPTRTCWAYNNGDYEVACVEDVARGWANSNFWGRKLLIRQSGRVVHEREDDSVYLEQTAAPGNDLNANGVPDVVIRFQSHGSGAYQTYQIFELDPAGLVKLSEFYTRGEGPSASFVDKDNDGIYEIIADDWIYDGDRSHPVPSMLLWDGGQFVRAPSGGHSGAAREGKVLGDERGDVPPDADGGGGGGRGGIEHMHHPFRLQDAEVIDKRAAPFHSLGAYARSSWRQCLGGQVRQQPLKGLEKSAAAQ